MIVALSLTAGAENLDAGSKLWVEVFGQILVALVGLLMYVLNGNPKLAEMGRIMFFCGVLAFLLTGAEKLVTLLQH